MSIILPNQATPNFDPKRMGGEPPIGQSMQIDLPPVRSDDDRTDL